MIELSRIELKNFTFTTSRPNNVAIMNNGDIIIINSIFVRAINNISVGNIIIESEELMFHRDVFNCPMPSREVGIMYVRKSGNAMKRHYVEDISTKCIYTKINNKEI